ncbi:MAG: VanZ family protein [Phycisphaerae bacterium]|nr:VanZ family protein [Phycisphaerae bacterium]
MQRIRAQKLFLYILVFYWLSLLVATHIPVPIWVGKMEVSDKAMHFVAYMVLAFLMWFGTSFEKKADWRTLRPWLLTTIILVYGIADEFLQQFVNRSATLEDFTADVLGAAAAMFFVTVLPSRHAVMIPVTVCPVFIPSLVMSNLIPQNSIFEAGAYLAGFAAVTIIWIIYLSAVWGLKLKQVRLLPIFLLPPMGSILIVKLNAVLTNKPFGTPAILAAGGAVILTLIMGLFYVEHIKRVADENHLP